MSSTATSSRQPASGPIRSLKRTFSSSSTASAAVSGKAAVLTTAAGIAPKIMKKLNHSAFVVDFDEGMDGDDSFDWDSVDTSNGSGNSTSSTASISLPGLSFSERPAASSKSIATSMNLSNANANKTAEVSRQTSVNVQSPPRGPAPMQSASAMLAAKASTSSRPTITSSKFPPASQYLPIPAGLPKVASIDTQIDNCRNENTFGMTSGATAHLRGHQQVEMSLPAGALKAPFTSKQGRGQMSLSNYSFKGTSSAASTSSASTSNSRRSSTSALSHVDSNKRSAPWDSEGLIRDAKSARVAVEQGGEGNSKDKGKERAKLVNIKQQIVLSVEQTKVLKMVVEEGKNVFFTGSAGTGKSILLREIIASLKRKYAKRGADRVAVTASTGMAAANIGGTTIHSFAGIGLGLGTGEQLVDNVKKNRKATGRWMRTEVLVIDEVSMLDGDLFDKLAHIAARFRRKPDKPFGGIQLIMTGDFFQLPPVTKGGMPRFAFEANSWKTCIDMTVNLTKVFRQKDTEFVDMLNEMRFGQLSQASIAKFHKLKRQPKYEDGLDPTELFPTREQVDASNRTRLAALPGEEYVYTAEDVGEEPHDRMLKTLENVMAPRQLVLKLNAQVMSIKNHDAATGVVNGTVGKVIGFKYANDPNDEDEDNPDGDAGLADFNAKLDGLKKLEKDDERPGWKSKKMHDEKVPIVEWQLATGEKMRMRMKREEFKVEDVGDKVKAKRSQLPMICAWAMSIHKSQGQTLERVKCDLGRIFEKGQAYVALSRATSLDGLQILNFDAKKVLAHPKVITWTKTLTTLT